MNEKIRSHVELLFREAPKTGRTYELKEEIISNLNDRYNDMISQGKDPEQAYAIAIAGIGDVDELIKGLRDQGVFNVAEMEKQRQKSALLTSSAVGIYIVSFLFPSVINSGIGIVMMFLCWAFATGLLIYNSMSKPRYVKKNETMVEEFKEWKQGKSQKKALMRSIQGMVWMLSLIIFFVLGFFLDAFHPGWLVFLLAIVVNQIIRLIFAYTEGE